MGVFVDEISLHDFIYEYRVWKILFLQFLSTAQIHKDLGLSYITIVQSVIKSYVEPHELHHRFCRHSYLSYLGEYTNTPFKEENNGIKSKPTVTANLKTEMSSTTNISTLNSIRKKNRPAKNTRTSDQYVKNTAISTNWLSHHIIT